MPARNLRKILKVGCSKAVVLPPDWLRAMDLDKGATVEVLYDGVIIVKPVDVKVDFDALKREWQIAERRETP